MKTLMILLQELCLTNDTKSSSNIQEFEDEIRIWVLDVKYECPETFKYAYTCHKPHPTFINKWVHVIFLIFNNKFTQNTKINVLENNVPKPYLKMKMVIVHGHGVAEYGKF